MKPAPREDPLALAEVLASLSLATDAANGQPFETALRTAVLADGLARAAGLDDARRRDASRAALLRYIGCTGSSVLIGAAFEGEDVAARAAFATDEHSRQLPASEASNHWQKKAKSGGERLRHELAATNCEVGRMLAARLGVGVSVETALAQVFERWDGDGVPQGLAAQALSLPGRVVQVAAVAEHHHRLFGLEAAREEVRRRAGGQLDPELAACFLESMKEVFAPVEGPSVWTFAVSAVAGSFWNTPVREVARAFGDFADLKSAYTAGHSTRVAATCVSAANELGLEELRDDLEPAGFLHDLGLVGVPVGTLDSPGELSPAQWERVRLHAYQTQRLLERSPSLRTAGAMAGAHHERLDGSGYHHGANGTGITRGARLLAAADVWCALREHRAHRPAFTVVEAENVMLHEARDGRLDPSAVRAVLSCAGRHPPRATTTGGLTAREAEVIGLLARGHSNREIAQRLGMSERTAQHHVAHAYTKLGVSTRAAATLLAVKKGLVAWTD